MHIFVDFHRRVEQFADGGDMIHQFDITGVSSPSARGLSRRARAGGAFRGGRGGEPLAVVKVLKKLDLRSAQATAALGGGPVERTGPDFRRVSGNRRKASK